MHKKKENIRLRQELPPEIPVTEAMETEAEEEHAAMTGETATEDVGPAYDRDEEEPPVSAEGPPSGQSLEPPVAPPPGFARRRARRLRGREAWKEKGGHEAAHSSKKF